MVCRGRLAPSEHISVGKWQQQQLLVTWACSGPPGVAHRVCSALSVTFIMRFDMPCLLLTALPMQVKKKNILAMFANTADWAHTPREWLPHHHDAATKIQARQQGRVARATPQRGKDCTAGWQLWQGLRLVSTSNSP